ncbi:MAG TPA: proton-conducting transporter membrane subunit [Opitutaceae bacterium]|nr:proton-conducting transporter membrane subunit [Opitutaceae bacterium]
MNNAPVLPLLLPFLTGVAGLLFARPGRWRRVGFGVSAVVQLAVALGLIVATAGGGRLVLAPGGWGAALGIVFVVDLLAAIMLALAALTALACTAFAFASRPAAREHPLQLPLLQFLLVGISLAFVTGDLFNLFVAFEVMLIASYALLTLESDNRNVRHAWSYLAINLVGSAVFLLGCGLAYGWLGTLNFAELSVRLAAAGGDPRVVLLGLILLVVFAVKAGLFPLYYWLPDSYPILPGSMAAFYAGMLTKVGVYVLLRVFVTVFPPGTPWIGELLAWGAGATMVLGVLGAVSRDRVQHILAYHILSQIGFMVLAIGFGTPLAIAAAILYIMHHIVVKAALFLVGGAIQHRCGHDRLDAAGGLMRAAPWLAAGFLLQALSLAGLPPLSGFWGKYLIIVEGLQLGEWVLVGASVVASVLTLVSMLKIWLAWFWRPAPEEAPRSVPPGARAMSATVCALAALSLGIGFGAEGVFRLAREAAAQAMDRAGYVAAVRAVVPASADAANTAEVAAEGGAR